MDVEIVYFDGCPHVDEARSRIAAIVSDRTDVTVRLRRVDDLAEAERAGMHGSPTILIDGIDPFAAPDTPPSWGCRYYPPSIGSDGVPSEQELERVFA